KIPNFDDASVTWGTVVGAMPTPAGEGESVAYRCLTPRRDTMHASERWQRLAELLAARRARLNPEWADRTRFCADTDLSYRSLSDLENGRRDNYIPAWLAKVEIGRASWRAR